MSRSTFKNIAEHFPHEFSGYPDTDFSLKSSKVGAILGKNDTGYRSRYTDQIKKSKLVFE